MILDDFIHFNATGLYCPYGDFYLDPQQPVKNAVISHAHGDHAVSGNADVYCTAATHQFMLIRYGKNAGKTFHLAGFHQAFSVGKVNIILIPAGHILGSAQVLMEYEGIKYLYTGDYKLQPDATCEPYEFVQADVLITESTFANPETSHPDPVEEVKKMGDIKMNILLGAYGLGKSQRLIRMINDIIPQKKVLVHHRIMPLNQVYEKMGFPLGKHQLYGRKLMKNQDEYVYIVPPFTFDSYFKATGVKRLFASGWKNLQVNEQDTLMLSDHADWNDILQVVNHTQPKQLWTLHGDGKHLATHYRNTIFVKMLA
ncbi:MAG: MBL fold metallo-hydrolase RNA specificity domain-containing protein [Bacteroidota bacterium]